MNEATANSKYTTSNSTSGKPRRKFDKPPVKLACLQCRASRTRCDGKETCSNCLAKDKPCTYTQSKRGGARIRKDKKTVTIELEHVETTTSSPDSASNSGGNVNLDQSDLLELCQPAETNALPLPLFLAQPGAGLFYQDSSSEDADFIFDTIFASNFEPNDSGYGSPEQSRKALRLKSLGRQYCVFTRSDENILNAYYVYIHPYFPVLPPPEPHQVMDNPKPGVRGTTDGMFINSNSSDFMPSSPLSLALSATLALIPHPDDPDPTSEESVLLRRCQAQSFALSAVESIETESELLYSNTKPSEALSQGPSLLPRKPFHSKCPIENESIVALLILGTYEYAQRGNISKLRTRAGQALVAAMGSGLHARGNDDGPYAEADRRAWWMTYILVCQGSILSNTPSTIYLYDPRFTTPGPTFLADQKAWKVFLQAQQVIISATQFVLDLENTLKSKSTQTSIGERMLELEALIEPLVNEGDQWALEQTLPTSLDWCEMKVCQSLRGMARIKLNSARIKLHRYSAFYDIPVFTKKHCDLASTSDQANQQQAPPPICPCSSKYHNTIQSFLNLDFTQPMQITPSPPSSYSSTLSTPSTQASSQVTQQTCSILPFSSHFSAKVCMKSAFNIARCFQNLPYPDNTPNMLIRNELKIKEFERPRMVPVFACCAMQSSYAMVMLCYKTRAMGLGSGEESPAGRLLSQLGEGLRLVLDALRNYSIAYEALGGMKDQIGIAADSVNVMLRDISVSNMEEFKL